MSLLRALEETLGSGRTPVSPLIDFNKNSDQLLRLDLTSENKTLSEEVFSNTDAFCHWVDLQIRESGARFAIGGYAEHRVIYSQNPLFKTDEEPRIVHLGVDIWAPAGSTIFSPLDAKVHSFNFNNALGDYGGIIILTHQCESLRFHSLYGHLSLNSLAGLTVGMEVESGQKIADLGDVSENGGWPPHLHFQLIIDMEGMEGDYPGVCKLSEKERYMANCPDPQIILRYTF